MSEADNILPRLNYPADLPISAHREAIIQAIREHRVIIVAGETGSGKSTQLPKLCLEAGRGQQGRIGCTQPRRIAALSLANRVAEEMGGECGGLVGYKIRFNSRTGPATRIKFMTDGVLLAETQRDHLLRGYDTIIVDEAHERSLNVDFLLGLLQHLVAQRADLKVIITSATLDTEKFAARFHGAPVIQVPGRTFPVEVIYQPEDTEQEEAGEASHIERAAKAVRFIRRRDRTGDILIFMPTERDIRETVELLSKVADVDGHATAPPLVLPLFGRLSRAEQQRIFQPANRQKIVVATNIAETSLTVPGIRYVIDSGLARITMYNPRARTTKMPVMPISRASADQRKGRCGRIGPGTCIRLYTEKDYAGRPQFTVPEILRANLAEVILRMLVLELGDPAAFPFIDPPAARAIRDGHALLVELGAVDRQGRLTKQGRLMARLPLDPQISRMILAARDENGLAELIVIAAALSIQDPRVRPSGKEAEADAAHAVFAAPNSDFLGLLNLWRHYQAALTRGASRGRARKFCHANFLAYQRMREWEDIHGQITAILAEEKGFALNQEPAGPDAIHRSILSGSLRSIAMRKAKNIYLGGQGKELMIFPGSALFNRAGHWIMAAELVETTRLYARMVATIRPEWIEPLAGELCRSTYAAPHWEKNRGQVVALQKVSLFGLTIVQGRRVNFGPIDPRAARAIFIQSALVEGELRGDFDFLRRNQELLARLRDMEDRVRQRTIVVDDQVLFDFYDQRLESGVFDQAGLRRFIKRRHGDGSLVMDEADVSRQVVEPERLEQFPASLECGELRIPLAYAFAPGSEADGVSALIPSAGLAGMRSDSFEWLVPGLLTEKVIFLLKSLPKALRRQLVPLPQAAERLCQALTPGQGSLYQALERELARQYGVRVAPEHWTTVELPDHLRMRYCLVDGDGKPVQASRVLGDLWHGGQKSAAAGEGMLALQKKWERQGIEAWDFAGLPEKLPVTDQQGNPTGFCYPALAPEGNGTVAIKLCSSPGEGRKLTRQGLALLYSRYFANQLKMAWKDFSIRRLPWFLCEGLGGQAEMDVDFQALVLREIFPVRAGMIPDRQIFEAEVEKLKTAGVYSLVKSVADLVVTALSARRETMALLAKYEKSGRNGPWLQKIRARVDEILPANFLAVFDRQRLAVVPRYLRALHIRLERGSIDPAKDNAREAQLAPHVERLARCVEIDRPSEELAGLCEEYRVMVEEFRISLFAQEIKTAFPISVKRLEEKWVGLARILAMEGGHPEKR